MKKIIAYVADDGRQFDTEGACQKYERSPEFRDTMLASKLEPYGKMLDDLSFEEVMPQAIVDLWPWLKNFMPKFESAEVSEILE